MSAAYFILGLVLGGLISDAVLAVRIYRIFKNQQRRVWPGAGFWMAWKIPLVTQSARVRLGNIHAAATMFPLGPNHSDATREFVEVIRRAADVKGAPATEVKP